MQVTGGCASTRRPVAWPRDAAAAASTAEGRGVRVGALSSDCGKRRERIWVCEGVAPSRAGAGCRPLARAGCGLAPRCQHAARRGAKTLAPLFERCPRARNTHLPRSAPQSSRRAVCRIFSLARRRRGAQRDGWASKWVWRRV
eukprot:304027-Chlamydomonas_euryale.AAC.4